MSEDLTVIVIHLVGAVLAGGLVGIDRSVHARPAGFRTHALVCLASSLLMLATLYQWKWLPDIPMDALRTDPTRMAQGIMTGIGFLGAGVIFKEGLSIRGLTTAASIWITAAIGILIGVGFFAPAIIATVLTLGILSAFRWIEDKVPTQSFVHHDIRFNRDDAMPESELRDFLGKHGFSIENMHYRVTEDGALFEYKMVMKTTEEKNAAGLVEALREMPRVQSFRVSPTGN